ncbi:Transcriptional regulator containing an amidase domain and an AraC-type DNA-binding HTH domain [Caballeronia glathei]|jgi:transcriptional regulator GlxA family with amidase domain|uniref:AraC family transcriptional regulator n=1 Tax=Caballeronia glathei TaxID=60547 RepID=A0A069PUT6_9BURK|nr:MULTISPECIES: GlxA family transcriptional regulator [Burkholderiaceae]KDR44182.1 AraC family transcriptional regulator [Caballeronia glathei]TCK34669.1 AraC family transcriptional regulator with amidase-like domain [Paraburkholderia sp. BL8N3]CDY77459.1 Transcriptional regulator containing an amidase domain and an AraC-type DNA-binding HTH domain [Caballeronia glathei]
MLRVGIILYPGFQVMNLAVTTVFEFANLTTDEPLYEVALLSEHGGPVATSSGFAVLTQPFDDSRFDTILVVGDNFVEPAPPAVIAFLREAGTTARRIGATCTGAFQLAEAGLLDGRRATTHWFHAAALQRTHPRLKLDEDRIFIVDGPVWTSAGMTACIDLALALVEHDTSAEIARRVARKLVVYHRRSGGQSQFSALLDLEPKSDRIQTALTYAQQHLKTDLSVEDLAKAAHLSPRQFSRAFREETGQTPAKAIEHLRVEAARLMLESGRHGVDVVARDTGFGDRERMRRAFLRAFGQPPQAIQRMVQGSGA